jgi:hypothetical protein
MAMVTLMAEDLAKNQSKICMCVYYTGSSES